MKTDLTKVFAIMAASILPSCATRVLEMQEIPILQVRQVLHPDSIEVNLMGVTIHSSLLIDKIEALRIDDSLHVLVYAGLFGNNSGNINYTLTVPDDVNTIVFGENKRIIWSRIESGSNKCYQLRIKGMLREERCDLEEIFEKGKEQNMIARAKIIEAHYMMPFQVKEISKIPQVEIQLQGSVKNNTVSVERIVALKNKNILHVLVYPKFTFHKRSDSYDLNYTLRIPADVDTVTFGEEEKIIWARHSDD